MLQKVQLLSVLGIPVQRPVSIARLCELNLRGLKANSYKPRHEKSKKMSNDQELIQSDPTSCPQNQKGNN